MNHSVELELLSVIKDYLVKNDIQEIEDVSELHDAIFGQEYYIVGYSDAYQWLKKHQYDAFEAIRDVIVFEEELHGTTSLTTEDINAEYIVNMLVCWYGYDIINDLAKHDREHHIEAKL